MVSIVSIGIDKLLHPKKTIRADRSVISVLKLKMMKTTLTFGVSKAQMKSGPRFSTCQDGESHYL
jgi:hypothetical protein